VVLVGTDIFEEHIASIFSVKTINELKHDGNSPFIWSCVSGLKQCCGGSDTECADLEKSGTKTLAMIRLAFRKEGMRHTQVFDWKSLNSQVNSKVKSMLNIFFDIKGSVHK
jgi:hypothetical protein